MNQQAGPAKRMQNLLIQVVEDETLIYDERRHMAFCLDRLASAIWQNSDGTRTANMIASACSLQLDVRVEEAAVLIGLAQLERDGLLEKAPEAADGVDVSTLRALSRRAMLGRVGLGAAMIVPVVAAVIAPRPAQAASGCFNCTNAQRRHTPTQSQE